MNASLIAESGKWGNRSRSAIAAASWGARAAALFRSLGPGLITGAADDDPCGIATYSQIGAQFGFAMLWTLVFA
jgi:Mn2+/Fe2+ NRAMP family transporter